MSRTEARRPCTDTRPDSKINDGDDFVDLSLTGADLDDGTWEDRPMTTTKPAAAVHAEARAFAANHPHIDWTWTEQSVRFIDAEGNPGRNLRVILTSDRPEHGPSEFSQCVWDDGDATPVAINHRIDQ